MLSAVLRRNTGAMRGAVPLCNRKNVVLVVHFSDGPNIHGDLHSTDVSSKFMKKKLAAAERGTALVSPRSDLPPQVVQEPTPPRPQITFFNQQQPPGAPPVTFGQAMKSNFVAGISITLGMILVLVLLRAVGLEGGPSVELGTGEALPSREECDEWAQQWFQDNGKSVTGTKSSDLR